MVTIVNGVNSKPEASRKLKSFFSSRAELGGTLYFGYPLISTFQDGVSLDALWVSPQNGLIAFDLVEGTSVEDYEGRQDDIYNSLEAKLKGVKELNQRRKLRFRINVITYAPVANSQEGIDDSYPLCDDSDLLDAIRLVSSPIEDETVFRVLASVLQSMTSIKGTRRRRKATKEDSRGSKISKIDDSIACLDRQQNRAVIETVEGIQRIRGLAGSGKTIVLALKAVYLHVNYPDWKIAVTFNTRSLKEQYHRLISAFHLEQTGEEPLWENLQIINAWGAPGGSERAGVYYNYCEALGVPYRDFGSATNAFGNRADLFGLVCQEALNNSAESPEIYDAILIDEAQDFSPAFFRLCLSMLKKPKRLVYAYDELQDLNVRNLPSPEELFGRDENGNPLVRFDSNRTAHAPEQDIILEKCYRNPRQTLIVAHALGFGIYREKAPWDKTQFVQFFEQPELWKDIGYRVVSGELSFGAPVVLERTDESSPSFLESHSDDDDLLFVKTFANKAEQDDWIAGEIEKNIKDEELTHGDIIVIDPNPRRARENLGPIRAKLLQRKILSHTAGVDTSPDSFFSERESVTFTGIFRAKGNEAPMVYIVNAESCFSGEGDELARKRNELFTAITRSRAWVRIVGVGEEMAALEKEVNKVRENNFRLSFTYPTSKEMDYLRIVNRGKEPGTKEKIDRTKTAIRDMIKDFEEGVLFPEDFDTNELVTLLQHLQSGRKTV